MSTEHDDSRSAGSAPPRGQRIGAPPRPPALPTPRELPAETSILRPYPYTQLAASDMRQSSAGLPPLGASARYRPATRRTVVMIDLIPYDAVRQLIEKIGESLLKLVSRPQRTAGTPWR